MTNLIQSIIFTILGTVTLVFGIITNAGWEIIGLGAAITVFAVGCLIYSIIKKKN